ncbi:MAG TPA: hypothetical protein V6D00_08545 [Pantanalinema sp.]
MLEKATALVASYNAMVMVAIAAFGIASATVWTLAMRQRKSRGES